MSYMELNEAIVEHEVLWSEVCEIWNCDASQLVKLYKSHTIAKWKINLLLFIWIRVLNPKPMPFLRGLYSIEEHAKPIVTE